MNEVFADSFYLLALINPSDGAHAQTMEVSMRCLNSQPGFHEPQNVRQTRRDAVSRVPGVTIR